MTIDPLATAGFAHAAGAYDRGRPSYPPAAIQWPLAQLELGRGDRVLDLAAGTGKLTEALAATGLEIVAVEPVDEMRAVLARRLPSAEVLAGTAERLPLPADSLAAAFVGEAFHWFDGPSALRELRRVLRPQAGLALLWNVPEFSDVGWAPRWGELIAPYVPDEASVNRRISGRWRDAFAHTELFGPLELRAFEHAHRVDREGFVAYAASLSFIASLPDGQRAQLLGAIGALADETLARSATKSISVPFRTEVYFARAQ